MDDNDAINVYTAPKIIDYDLSSFEFQDKEANACLSGISDEAKALASTHQLTQKEVAAIRAYTQNYYLVINYQLRNLPDPNVNIYDAAALKKLGVNPDMADLIANLVNGLKKLPPAQLDGQIVRGHGRDANLPEEELEKFKEGSTISPSMFISTTNSLEQMVSTSWWNTNPQAIVIHQIPNGNGRDIAAFSSYQHESEILFHLDAEGRLVGASGLSRSNKIAKDIRLAEMLIAKRSHPDQQALVDPKFNLKSLLNA